ncbi:MULTISPECIES: patatin-like phospholipase family protein [unclassified Micromonospora]|uniref:patatin-like phospholipase family protein n=1 Tax=unclassified Micromonospora TaxID=2617518 RepID=UPI0033D8B7C1
MSDEMARPDVWQVIRDRLAGKPDDHVLALTLEGGGMRGVVSGAMLIALRDLGITRVFDRMYGTSSGSINLAYFAAGGSWDALSVYYDHLPRGFVNPAYLVHRPRLNMPYVFERVMREEVPLDTVALADSPFDVRIALSNVDTMLPEPLDVRDVAPDIHRYLMAGSWLPILAGRPYRLDGHRYLDGGLLWPDPLYPALADGATHVLMINTAPEGTPTDANRVTSFVLHRTLNQWARGLGDAALEARIAWEADKQLLKTGTTVDVRGTSVLRLRPAAGSHRVRRLTLDRGTLLDGARVGYQSIFEAFGRPLDGAYFSISGRRSAEQG